MIALPAAPARPIAPVWIPVLKTTALAVLAVGWFFPYLLEEALPAPYPMFAALWVYGVVELLRRRSGPIPLALWIVLPVLALLLTYYLFSLPAVVVLSLGEMPGIVRDYLLVLPVALAAGLIAAGDEELGRLVVLVRGAAAGAAVLALAERVLGRQLFSGNVVEAGFGAAGGMDALAGEGGLRSVGASEHPLVLATVLLVALPLVLRGGLSWRRLTEAALLVAGIAATESAGPLMLAVAVAVLAALRAPVLHVLARTGPRIVDIGFAAGTAVFLACAALVWRPVVETGVGLDDSSQYRFALFSLIPRIVLAQPLGYGLGAVPAGELLIETQGRPLDVATTVDSELVLLVIQAGALGLAAYLAVLWVSVRCVLVPQASPVGPGPLLVVTLTGLILALHVWSSVGVLWEFLVGLGAAGLVPALRGTTTQHRRPETRSPQ